MATARNLCFSGALLLAAVVTVAQPQTPKQKHAAVSSASSTAKASAPLTPAAKLQGLDDLADQAMKQWKVPGVAIAVVQHGKVPQSVNGRIA